METTKQHCQGEHAMGLHEGVRMREPQSRFRENENREGDLELGTEGEQEVPRRAGLDLGSVRQACLE